MGDNVRIIISSQEQIESDVVDVLDQMAQVEGVVKPVVALPDIHHKLSYHTPTGVVVMAEDKIIPKFLNPNCGMSFVVTSLFSDGMNDEKMDVIYDHIRENISVATRVKPAMTQDDLKEVVVSGAEWALKKFGLNAENIDNFENKGSLFKDKGYAAEDIMKFIPESCRSMGLLSLNVLGYGNHFIEMQEVEEIYDERAAELFGIRKNQICFMMHGDSRAFGRSISDFYSKKAKKLFGLQQMYKKIHYKIVSNEKVPESIKKLLDRFNYKVNRLKSAVYWKFKSTKNGKKQSFPVIQADSQEGEAYKIATYAAQNFGYANRTSMTAVIRDGLDKAFPGDKIGVNILYDGNHDCLQEEEIDGKTYLAHRNGASKAVSKEGYKGHPFFSETGQPVLLPSSMGNPSFVLAAGEGCRDSFYSAPHGAGRLIDRGEAREKFAEKDVVSEIETRGMRVYDYGRGNVSEESPRAFKDIDDVVRIVEESGIAKPVAKMRPLAVLKGWT